jgi:23S rRNA (cytidine1920-2'-O)/16S rRNA (cytidine1409-2'-O)-methyltransferase
VLVAGAVAAKASRLVAEHEPLRVLARPRFVSRGGEKLDAALEEFPIKVAGAVCLDVGASTGGFTDCLLARGAALVTAIDVGHGQLHPRLREDPRVAVLERTDIRRFAAEEDEEHAFDIVVADLSFISLTGVLGRLLGCCRTEGDVVVLVKPQFEVGRAAASQGKGVIRDPGLWRRSLGAVAAAGTARGAALLGAIPSPVRGPAGNVEFLLHLRPRADAASCALPEDGSEDLDEALLDAAVDAVGA